MQDVNFYMYSLMWLERGFQENNETEEFKVAGQERKLINGKQDFRNSCG